MLQDLEPDVTYQIRWYSLLREDGAALYQSTSLPGLFAFPGLTLDPWNVARAVAAITLGRDEIECGPFRLRAEMRDWH